MALPGNTFLHKILPTPERQRGDLWGSLLQKPSPGVAQPVEFFREFGSNEGSQPVTFLVEFKKHKHWRRERPMGRGPFRPGCPQAEPAPGVLGVPAAGGQWQRAEGQESALGPDATHRGHPALGMAPQKGPARGLRRGLSAFDTPPSVGGRLRASPGQASPLAYLWTQRFRWPVSGRVRL